MTGNSNERMRDWRSKVGAYARINIMVCQARTRAAKKGVPFNITPDHVRSLYKATGGRCALTDFPFQDNGPASPLSMSIDRIVPALGYVPGNVRLILNGLNSLKGTGTDDNMWLIIDAMVARRH